MSHNIDVAPLPEIPVHEVPRSLAQADKPKKKQYRATTTWHLKPYQPPNLIEGIARIDLGPLDMYEPKGEDWIRSPMPRHPTRWENLFIWRWAVVPFVVQYLAITYHQQALNLLPTWAKAPAAALLPSSRWSIVGLQYIFYQVWFQLYALNVLKRCQRFMRVYGSLNEAERGRDIVPDSHHVRVVLGLIVFSFVRNIGVFLLTSAADKSSPFPSLSYLSPVKIGLWLIALDYFFYLYHRATHEIDALWFVHRQHHATKAPTPQMSLWADEIQDSLEWAIVPFLAFSVVRLSFAELYVGSMYLLYIEAFGHSGIRAYWTHPLLTCVLKPLGVELAIEDHDLHHRYGRGGKNYGKQTRIFDTIFGTVAPREEERKYAAMLARQEQLQKQNQKS